MEEPYDLIIVGAGPYGLSVAAHLNDIQPRPRLRVFGEPMSFWSGNMPLGMLLRSPWVASNLSDPKGALTLDAFRSEQGLQFEAPIPLDCFTSYGHWFQQRAVPEVDSRKVTNIESSSATYVVTLADGEQVWAKRVIVATGIGYFPNVPAPFRDLPSELASHSSAHRDLRQFGGRDVAVIGAGQSALESAALLHEAGARVQVLARTDSVHWLHGRSLLHRWPLQQLLYAPPDVGPALLSQLVARPDLFRRVPRRLQDKWEPRAVRPAGARWLRDRLRAVPIDAPRSVVRATPEGERIRLELNDRSARVVDHVMLGTGYRVDLQRYPFLDPALLSSVRAVRGYPVLDRGFETSAKGLHLVGAPAAWSFGPLMRFVAGAEFASRAVANRVAAG